MSLSPGLLVPSARPCGALTSAMLIGLGLALPCAAQAEDAPAEDVSPEAAEANLSLRVGYHLASYQYAQSPNLGNLATVEHDITKAAVNETPRLVHGAVVGGRYWFKRAPVVGLDAQVRASAYSVEPQSICESLATPCPDQEAMGDWLVYTHLLWVFRYRFGDDGPVYAAARFGYTSTDFQITTTEEDGSTSNRGVMVGAIGLGAEAGADLGDLSLVVAYTHHIADYGKTPFGSQAELDLRYNLSPTLSVGLGAERFQRRMPVTKGDVEVGVIRDNSLGGRLTLGVGF